MFLFRLWQTPCTLWLCLLFTPSSYFLLCLLSSFPLSLGFLKYSLAVLNWTYDHLNKEEDLSFCIYDLFRVCVCVCLVVSLQITPGTIKTRKQSFCIMHHTHSSSSLSPSFLPSVCLPLSTFLFLFYLFFLILPLPLPVCLPSLCSLLCDPFSPSVHSVCRCWNHATNFSTK